MEPARHDPERYSRIGPSRTPVTRCADDEGAAGIEPRRIEKEPALAMVLAPLVGLLIWGALIAIVF